MKNFFKKIKNIGKGRKGRDGSFDAESDWKKIFLCAIFLFLISVGINYFIFFKVQKGEIFKKEIISADGLPKIDKEKLEKGIRYFEGKKARYENIKKDRPVTFDPAK